MFPDESNDQGATARDEKVSPLDDDRGTDAGDGAFEALLVAFDEGLVSGSTANIPDLTSVPPDLAAELRGVQDCLSLLHAASRAGQLDDLAPSGIPRRPNAPATLESMDRIGRFEIVRELGRGGYGIVFLALDPDLGRRVALKVPRPEALVTPELRRRFLREAEAAGSLQHPNLVTVYEAGEDGPLCYLVTAYCDGPTLAQWLKDRKDSVTPQAAAQLARAIAEGVEHAHSLGVLHRDIKPSNVMLESLAGTRAVNDPTAPLLSAFTPKLTDFGLAKLLDRPHDETRTGTLLGTPAYMAPEQAAGRMRDICAATDVYGLGVLLYEVLTGQPPFRGENDPDTLRQVCVEEPVPPGRLRPGLPGDLHAICLKCLEKKPSNRYQSAKELARDLARFLAGEPTLARPATPWQRVLKWSRRKPATAALVGVIVAAAISLASIVGAYTIRLGTALADAERGQTEANQQRQVAQQNERRADTSRADTRRLLYSADIKLASEAYHNGDPHGAVERLSRYLPTHEEQDLREFAWRYLWHRCRDHLLTLRGHTGPVLWASYSHDGRLVATTGQDGTIRLWETDKGQPLAVLIGHQGDVNCLSFSPDDRWLASAGVDAAVRIWDVATGEQIESLAGHRDEVFAVRFSPSGRWLASGGREGRVLLWETADWSVRGTLEGHTDFVESLAFAPDEKTLVSGGADSVACLWDLDRLEPRATLAGNCRSIYSVCFSPTGGRLAMGSQDGQIVLWDVASERELRRTQSHSTHVTSVAFSPDGRRLLSSSRDGSARLWDVTTGELEAVCDVHAERLWHVEFSPDGTQFLTASSDQTVKLCKLSDAAETLPQFYVDRGEIGFSTDGDLRTVSRDGPDGRGIAVHHDGKREIWQPSFAPIRSILTTALEPVGPSAAAIDASGRLFFWDPQSSWRFVLSPFPTFGFVPLAISPGGHFVATTFTGIRVVETNEWRSVLTVQPSSTASWLSFTRNGRQVAAGLQDGTVMIWDLNGGAAPRSWKSPSRGPMFQGDFTSDGTLLAVACEDGRVLIFDVATGTVRNDLATGARVRCVVFSNDGTNLATVSDDQWMRVWDVRTGRELLALSHPDLGPEKLAFSPDGTELVGNLTNGQLLRWTAPRDGGVPSSTMRSGIVSEPSTADRGIDVARAKSFHTLPLGEPRRIQDLTSVFVRFALLSGRRQVIMRPTFDDRESDSGLLIGGLILKNAAVSIATYSQITDANDFVGLARDADTYARSRDGQSGYPFLTNHGLNSIALLPRNTFERRDVPGGELEEVDTEIDLCREITRWAKRHGFAGGFPVFIDGQLDGKPIYGAVLIPPEFGQEVFLPARTVWQSDTSANE